MLNKKDAKTFQYTIGVLFDKLSESPSSTSIHYDPLREVYFKMYGDWIDEFKNEVEFSHQFQKSCTNQGIEYQEDEYGLITFDFIP